jgi:Ca-activated chloride channel family protein
VAIYAMGIGIEAAPIPLPDGTMLTQGGKVVRSAPDFTVLQQVAERTGGAFVQSVASTRDVEGLYQGEIRRKLVTVERSSSQRETWRAAFQWPLTVGLLLWLAGAWLGDGRRPFGSAQAGVALLVLGLLGPAAAWASTVEDADRLFRAERFAEAAEQLTELSLESPTDADVFDRLGAARYRSGDFDGAARAWDEASRLRGGDADALYNSGNANYRSGRLEDALARYDEALQIAPEHRPTQTNQEVVEKALQARRQKPPPSGGGGGDQDEQEGQGSSNQGEQGASGEQGDNPSEGSQQGGQPQDGQPQDGQPQDGSSEGQPQDGSESPEGEPGESGSDGSADGAPTEQEPEGEGSDTVRPGELDPSGEGEEGSTAEQVSGGAIDESQGPITAGQAERLLDGIEEGSQRVYVRGKGEEKPW